MPTYTKYLVIVFALCAGIASYSVIQLQKANQQGNQTERRDMLNQPRPDFSLYDDTKQLRDIKEWDGQVIVLNFWGTWCPPCLKEIPDLNAFYTANQDNNVALIGIAHDSLDKVLEFKEDLAMQYTQLVDPMLAVELSKLYGNEFGTLPFTVVIDQNQIIRYIHQNGIISQADLQKVVDQWL